MKFLQKGILRTVMLVAATTGLGATAAQAANPMVRVSTTFGDFTVELYQDRTPATVQNFLGYVDRGDFSRMVLHRLDPNFVIQAGSHKWNGDCAVGILPPACGPALIPTQPEVVNEPGISNTRGTLAMAKRDGFPNSATSQWFVNLGDNSSNLDEQNGGFTVFGIVMGDGMDVATRINALPLTIPVSTAVSQLPVRDFDTTTDAAPTEKHLVLMNAWRVDRFSSSLHVFEFRTGRLSTYVNAGEFGKLSLLLNVVGNTGSETIFQIDPTSIIPLAIEPEGMATFSAGDQRLRIPRVEVDDNGQLIILNNVVLRMIDQASLRFVLESYEVAS